MTSKPFGPLRLLRGGRRISREMKKRKNDTKTKRIRFASEIVGVAKSLTSLRSEIAEFRGFQPFQGVGRFAKRFFEFCVQNVLLTYTA